MAKRDKTRTLVTPTIDMAGGGGFVATDDKLVYWKQVLPEATINYTDDTGETRVLNFDTATNAELVEAYHAGAMPQTPFMLADKDNAHTMDPERYRADVVDMRLANEGEDPGVYAKIKFASKKAAKSVLNNPALGVSARIRENVENARTGQTFKRAFIHVLGTLDPKITGMSGWTPAVDLSTYSRENTIDLSGMTYAEAAVAKIKRNGETITPAKFAAMSGEDITSAEFTDAEITQLVQGMDDDTLAAFIASDALSDANEPDEENDDLEDDDLEDDDDDDDADSDAEDRQLVGADLSNNARREIDLANSRADAAMREARKATAKQAEADWKAERTGYLADGVPPWVLDLAKPVLAGSDDFVIDLSNHGGAKDVNASDIVRKLVAGYRGDVDLSREDVGHGDAEGDDRYAADRAALDTIEI